MDFCEGKNDGGKGRGGRFLRKDYKNYNEKGRKKDGAEETYLSSICVTCQLKCTRISFATAGKTWERDRKRASAEKLLQIILQSNEMLLQWHMSDEAVLRVS